ncbi:hypothetical protein C8F01DRAFT_1099796 [Mycena amicta]|nr:hypothetical protein C8F01DRAFT_1099796 [Mycena amicta]
MPHLNFDHGEKVRVWSTLRISFTRLHSATISRCFILGRSCPHQNLPTPCSTHMAGSSPSTRCWQDCSPRTTWNPVKASQDALPTDGKPVVMRKSMEGAWPDLDAVLDPQSCAVVLRIACTWSAETMALIDDEGYRTACWECMGFPVEKRNREGMWFRLPILKVPDGYTYDAAQMPTCRHLAYF